MRYMLDTNICIHIIRQKPLTLVSKLTSLPAADVVISSITLSELEYGVAKSSTPQQNRQALDTFLVPITVLDFDYDSAIIYGGVRAGLEKRGTKIGPLDTLIAAHALSRKLTLVTNNVREFQRVPGLIVEDWS
jgi:tRNA(fMet)-specific endonuclease VapC